VPQHYTNVFCPCGEFSFQRDYVLRHQRIARCHTGQVSVVDEASFPEFQDLILPHICDPHKRATLAQGFPACRPTQETSDEEAIPTAQPSITQPLLARVDNNKGKNTPVAGQKRRRREDPRPPTLTPVPAETVRCPHEAEVFRLRRQLRRVNDELRSIHHRLDKLEGQRGGRRH